MSRKIKENYKDVIMMIIVIIIIMMVMSIQPIPVIHQSISAAISTYICPESKFF